MTSTSCCSGAGRARTRVTSVALRAVTLALVSRPGLGAVITVAAQDRSALPPGVMRDNALLLEQNDPEIRKLTNPGGQS